MKIYNSVCELVGKTPLVEFGKLKSEGKRGSRKNQNPRQVFVCRGTTYLSWLEINASKLILWLYFTEAFLSFSSIIDVRSIWFIAAIATA